MTEADGSSDDAAVLRALRAAWGVFDPVPADLNDRMIAAVAVEDLSRDFALLELCESEQLVSVRSAAGRVPLEFRDDSMHLFLQIGPGQRGHRRIDGWSQSAVLAARLVQGERVRGADTEEGVRFSFSDIPAARSCVRLVVRAEEGIRELQTPWFEVAAA